MFPVEFNVDVWHGSSQCKIYINPKHFKGNIVIKPTSQYHQKTRIYGNYVDDIWNNRPSATGQASKSPYWDMRWHGSVVVAPFEDLSTSPMSRFAPVLIDWDSYQTEELRMSTSAEARVQMTSVVVPPSPPY